MPDATGASGPSAAAPPWWRQPGFVAAWIPVALLAGWLAFGPKPWDSGVQAALENHQNPKPKHHAVTGLWYGAAASLPLAAALAVIMLALRRRPPVAPDDFPPAVPAGQWLMFGICAAGLMAVTAREHAPRLGQSLWDDEEKAMRFFTVGRYQEAKADGAMKFIPATWTDAFFNYRQPNNHIFFTLLSKASHDALGPMRESRGPYFSERALRLPAFLAGLAAIAGLGASLCLLGHQRAGLWAMPLLALHPWFLRYLVEARGYSLVLMLGPLALAAAYRALASGRARWWTTLGIAQFLLLYTFPGCLHFAAWLNLCLLGAIATVPALRPRRPRLLLQWLATNLASGIVLLILMAPSVPQLLDYLREKKDALPMTAAILVDLPSMLLTGSPWRSWDPTNPLSLGLRDVLAGSPLAIAAAATLMLSIIAGATRLARRSPLHAWLLPAMLLPAVTFPLHSALKGHPFYLWYAIGALPFLLALAALGADWPARPLGGKRSGTVLALACGLGLAVLFAQLTANQRAITSAHPIEPKRDAVQVYRGDALNPEDPAQRDIITVGFHQENLTYDPRLRRLDDVARQDAFDAVLAEADKTGKPLYVDFGQEGYARQHFGHIFSRLDDPALFERIAVLYGLEPQNTRVVMRYRKTASGAENATGTDATPLARPPAPR